MPHALKEKNSNATQYSYNMIMSNIPDFSGRTVLAVDDVPVNVILLKTILTRIKVSTVTASNGKEALEALETVRPDLILLDLRMPVMDGFEFLSRIKNSDMADIPVVVVSAFTAQADIDRAMGLGAADFIQKPVIMGQLIECIGRHLNAQGQE